MTLKTRYLLFVVTMIASTSSVQAFSLAEMKERTAVIADRYLEIWSLNNTTPIAGVPYMYGPTVTFYGRPYTQDMLIAEKRRAIRQWPNRRYSHRPGSMNVTCNLAARKCAVRSIIDFEVSNRARGTDKSGSARFDLGVSFAENRPRILYEGGSLNNRHSRH